MILVDGEKYACVQCIRGHRSSTCRHSARPLVQVRGRGRPSLNQTHRIAVTESELVLSREEVDIHASVADATAANKPKEENSKGSCCSGKSSKTQEDLQRSCCSVKKLPKASCCAQSIDACRCGNQSGVILLKASKREFVDVNGGSLDFVGPYSGSSTTKFKLHAVGKPKHTKSSVCSKKTSSLKALKTLKVSQVPGLDFTEYQHQFHYNQVQPFQSQQLLQQPQPQSSRSMEVPPQPETQPVYTVDQLHAMLSQTNFDKYLSVYQKQFENNRPPPQQLQQPGQRNEQFNYPDADQHLDSMRTFGQQLPPQGKSSQLFDMFVTDGCADECDCGPECGCPGCLIHRTNEELREYGILDSSTTGSTPSELRDMSIHNINRRLTNDNESEKINVQPGTIHNGHTPEPKAEDLINFHTIDELLLQEMFEEDCGCDPSECKCYNCIKHGISEGVRLIDGVRVAFWDEPVLKLEKDDEEMFIHDCQCTFEECSCYNCPKHCRKNGVRITKI